VIVLIAKNELYVKTLPTVYRTFRNWCVCSHFFKKFIHVVNYRNVK